jgi:hypothetical protein
VAGPVQVCRGATGSKLVEPTIIQDLLQEVPGMTGRKRALAVVIVPAPEILHCLRVKIQMVLSAVKTEDLHKLGAVDIIHLDLGTPAPSKGFIQPGLQIQVPAPRKLVHKLG